MMVKLDKFKVGIFENIFLCLISLSSNAFSADNICFSMNEAINLKKEFLSGKSDYEYLKKTSTTQAYEEIEYESVLIKNPSFIKNATEVIYTMEGFDSENSHSKSVNLS